MVMMENLVLKEKMVKQELQEMKDCLGTLENLGIQLFTNSKVFSFKDHKYIKYI